MTRVAILALAAIVACAGHHGEITPLPTNPHKGAPRAFINARSPIIRGRPYRVEFVLLGNPRSPKLRAPVAYHFTILADGETYREISWADPQVTRFFRWTIPAHYTRDFKDDYVTIHVEVCNLAGYTYAGTPLMTKPFTRDAVRLRVMHPVAGGKNFEERHRFPKTPHPAL